uniref:protein-serine/threonine phosphatase n=1 Tax=Zea mays TaxID=4577 RepID=A0A804P1Z9_MAIZE
MVEAAAGRRSGTSRRRPSGSGGEHQRLVALAVAARVAMVSTRSAGPAVAGGDGAGAAGTGAGPAAGRGRCMEDFFDCLLGLLGALGMTWATARPQRQPLPPLPRGVGAGPEPTDARRFAAALRATPGRIAGNGACAVASLYTLQGKKGVNQDAMIFWELGADLGMEDGRVASTGNIKLNTNDVASSEHIVRGGTAVSSEAQQNGDYPEVFPALRTSFLKAFHVMDRDLKLHKNIDCFFSGTTAVAVIKQGHNLIIGNLGDSRAVLGTRDENNQLVAVQLTVDLKPDIPSESQRIRQRRGRIFALPEEPEVARVWLPRYNSPGLAMARAFGDFCLKDHGVISVPDVSYHHITEKDEFVVLATDGVWDVLSNDEVVNTVSRVTSRASAARFLVESAHRAWRTRFPTSKVDDCAAVCLFLNTNEASESSSSLANNLADAVQVSTAQCSKTIQVSAPIDGNEVSVVETR